MIELRLLLVKKLSRGTLSKGCVQCADLKVISRLTVGEVGVVITHIGLILNVGSQLQLFSYFLAN